MATLVATPQLSIATTASTSPDAAPSDTTDATPECAVCCEAFSTNTRSCRRRVSCPACDYAVCYKCVRTYLKDLEAAPRCMNCQHPWDEEFRHTVLSQAFCQVLREKAIIRMVDREKALLPQTQIHLERKAVHEERMVTLNAIHAEYTALLANKKAWNKKLGDVNIRHRIAQGNVRNTNVDLEGHYVRQARVEVMTALKDEQQAIIIQKKELQGKLENVNLRRNAALRSALDVGRILDEDRRDPLRIQEQPIPPIHTAASMQAMRTLEALEANAEMYQNNLHMLQEANDIAGHEEAHMVQFLQEHVPYFAHHIVEYQTHLRTIAVRITDVQTTFLQTPGAEDRAPHIHTVVTRIAEKIANALAAFEIHANANIAENTVTIPNITTANVPPTNTHITNATPTNTTDNVPPNNTTSTPTEPPAEPHAGRGCEQDGCRGFLNRQGKCGVCNTWVCAKCHKVKAAHHDPDHECNEDDVKTVALLTKETKPCPGCGIYTQRISGCSQMWCTQCHTSFSWTTGEAITSGPIHNPHLYEWRQQQIIEHGAAPPLANVELPCNGPLGYDHQQHVLATLHQRIGLDVTPTGEPCTVVSKLSESMRFCGHLMYTVQRLHRRALKCEQRKFDLRIRYLKNDLTPEKWHSQLKRVDKTEKRAGSQRLALSVYTTASSDLFRTAYHCTTLDELITRALQPLDKLTDYVNQQLDVIDNRHQFKGKPVRITSQATEAGRWVMGYGG